MCSFLFGAYDKSAVNLLPSTLFVNKFVQSIFPIECIIVSIIPVPHHVLIHSTVGPPDLIKNESGAEKDL